jgi:16S rRNA (guanine(527)-N(7))-methyltransferase RsmG
MPVNEGEMTKAADEFARALELHAPGYEVRLSAETLARLTDYYRLLSTWNARLHLVAPCAPAEFATRHVLESLVALRFIPEGAHFADVGTGGGLPAIPCLVARASLRATLIEASAKKAIFLREAIRQLGLRERAEVRAERFEQIPAPPAEFVTCRALERFTEMLPRLVAWAAQPRTFLLFGGPAVQAKIKELGLSYAAEQMSGASQRFLFIIRRES